MRCLPAVFLAGFPKCGTTDLYRRLGEHPDIVTPRSKEPHWWSRKRFGVYSLSDYVELFDDAANIIATGSNPENKLTVDGSASTVWDLTVQRSSAARRWKTSSDPLNFRLNYAQTAPRQIRELLPRSRVVLIVCNPVGRTYSDFVYFNAPFAGNDSLQETFRRQVRIQVGEIQACLSRTGNDVTRCALWIRGSTRASMVRLYVGIYYVYIEIWRRFFPAESIKVVKMEEYSEGRAAVLNDVARFLGLGDYPDDVIQNIANSSGRYNAGNYYGRSMADDVHSLLQSFYQPFNEKLANLLNDNKFQWE